MIHESIIGSRFTGSIVGTATVAGEPTKCSIRPSDPYPTGCVLAGTWGVSGTTSQ